MIYCVGDSHIRLFTGNFEDDGFSLISEFPNKFDLIKNIKTFYLGAHLAYSFSNFNHPLFENLKSNFLPFVPIGSTIFFVFGEIDCRYHLIKQSELQNKSLEFIVSDCVSSYISGLKTISKLGYKIGTFSVHPHLYEEWLDFRVVDMDIPFEHYGYYNERIKCLELFDLELNKKCKEQGFLFFSFFHKLLNIIQNEDYNDYYLNHNHLNQKAIPILLDTLKGHYNG
jgi:hypothetical protein